MLEELGKIFYNTQAKKRADGGDGRGSVLEELRRPPGKPFPYILGVSINSVILAGGDTGNTEDFLCWN